VVSYRLDLGACVSSDAIWEKFYNKMLMAVFGSEEKKRTGENFIIRSLTLTNCNTRQI
jgi:hypothetical protein